MSIGSDIAHVWNLWFEELLYETYIRFKSLKKIIVEIPSEINEPLEKNKGD